MNEQSWIDILGFEEKDFAIFCGAGISKNSGLPLAGELTKWILDKLPIDKEDIKEIIKDSNLSLPFEAFMEILSEHSDISRILDIFEKGEPNTNHLLMARLAKSGYLKTILTTNFDLLIEKAFKEEGLRENEEFEVYSDEDQFSRIDFENIEDKKVRIFKIHGSVDNRDSIRATMKAVASKTLSDKRINVIRYLFSIGNHKKVLILGYSCSDEFDITPQIQSIEQNQKEIIFIDHSNVEEIEDVKVKINKNPFKKFPGKRIIYDTDKFIENLWNSLQNICDKYQAIKSETEWKIYIDDWSKELENKKYLKYKLAGTIFSRISDYKKAIKYGNKSLKTAKEDGNRQGESDSYTTLGNAYDGLGDFKKAIEYYKKALDFIKKSKNKFGESRCYSNLGSTYDGLGDSKRAIECHENALKIAKEIEDVVGVSTCYANLGVSYYNLKDFKKMIKYNEKSLAIDKEIGDKAGESSCYTNLGIANHHLGNFKEAIEYFEKSLEIAKKIGNGSEEARCYANLGSCYNTLRNPLKDFKKAIEYHKQDLIISNEIGDTAGKARSYMNLGAVYYNLGDHDEAIECYLQAEKFYKKTMQIHQLKLLYENLWFAYEKIRDNKKVEDYKRRVSILENR